MSVRLEHEAWLAEKLGVRLNLASSTPGRRKGALLMACTRRRDELCPVDSQGNAITFAQAYERLYGERLP